MIKGMLALMGIVWLGISGLTINLTAQTVTARVTIQADRLKPEEQAFLAELPQQIENYINSFDWTGNYEDIRIDCGITFIIETAIDRGSDKIFRGQFAINSPSKENFVDKSIQFPYRQGQFFDHQQAQFDPLLGIIDFYIYMVIAGELDCYILRGGTAFYEKARAIANRALVSEFPAGWRNRLETVDEMTDSDHLPLREAKFEFYEGLFYVEARKDPQKAREAARRVVELLEQVHHLRPNSSALKRFLDYQYQEFCTLFKYDRDRRNIQRMMILDNRHREFYAQCQPEGAKGIRAQ
ncbi:MAG: DUF4835 family protein [Calditrichaeota bacterium]|nr:MAG: DUF4835 family protein [Calditrichota bacterium]